MLTNSLPSPYQIQESFLPPAPRGQNAFHDIGNLF